MQHTLLLAFTLAAFEPSAAARPVPGNLPPAVQQSVDEVAKGCGSSLRMADGFLTRHDVNGDGVADYILDYGHLTCAEQPLAGCTPDRCLLQIFVSTPALRHTLAFSAMVRDFELGVVDRTPSLTISPPSCGQSAADGCEYVLHWNGSSFH